MKYIDGGICAAKGFKASGTYCGIKSLMLKTLTRKSSIKTTFAFLQVMCFAMRRQFILKTRLKAHLSL